MEKLAIHGGKPVRDTKIFYGHQFIDEADVKAVSEVLVSDFLTCGPKIGELENKLCEITGAKYAVAVSNGTAALHLACMAAGVSEGDEVITTPITFAASANCALYCGAKPVFADIRSDTYNIDPTQVKQKISDKTKAVVAVDFTGQAVELDLLLGMCHEKDIIINYCCIVHMVLPEIRIICYMKQRAPGIMNKLIWDIITELLTYRQH